MKRLGMLVGVFALILGAGGGATAQEYSLKLSTVVRAPHPWISSAQYIQKTLEQKSEGKLKVTIYDSGKLGSDEVALTNLREGSVDFYIGGTANAATYIPEFSFFNMSFLYKNENHFEAAIKAGGPLDKRFRDIVRERKVDMEYLAMAGGGLRNMSNRLRPVKSIADVQGMKMRVPGGPVAAKVWEAFGTLPVSLPWTELYTALQTGVVDAAESTMPGYKSSKLYEVAKYLAKTEHEFMVSAFLMADKTAKKLPPDLLELVRKTVQEAALICTREGVDQTRDILVEMAKRGIVITEVDKSEFLSRSIPVQNEEAAKLKLTDALADIRKLGASY